mmetsp:Transcript_6575/g.9582  ORF Transcript_6575/g.9582 Transcript_6575/m.9582 type:complete len:306 (+) Transcript_6575:73-990(+)
MKMRTSGIASSKSYPRTGKRGVPQQFPRKLYEMLESESRMKCNVSSSSSDAAPSYYNERGMDQACVIEWSESGKAFRIIDVALFSSLILPKYFRTSKFSSFQRNLNLYGFSKVRRGPDTDMYAHPSFIRGIPEILSQLKKGNTSADRKHNNKVNGGNSAATLISSSESSVSFTTSSSLESHSLSINSTPVIEVECESQSQSYDRVVSPCHTRLVSQQRNSTNTVDSFIGQHISTSLYDNTIPTTQHMVVPGDHQCGFVPNMPIQHGYRKCRTQHDVTINKKPVITACSDNRLSLLALALRSLAEC